MTVLMEIIDAEMEPFTGAGVCCEITIANLKESLKNISTENFEDNEVIKTLKQMGFKYVFRC